MRSGWAPRSLRARAVLSAGVAVLIGAALISVVAVLAVRAAVTKSLDDSLAASIDGVVAQLDQSPPEVDSTVELPSLDVRDPTVIQVVDSSGASVAATPGIEAAAAICPANPAGGSQAQTIDLSGRPLSGTFRVLSEQVTVGGETLLVCAARSDQLTETARRSVLGVLALAVPLITALVCVIVARQVGRALDTVSALSSQADRLRSSGSGRLTVPDTQDEIEALAVTFNALLDKLQEQSDATRTFVADAGHELRTPLSSMRLALDLAPDPGSPWTRELVSDVDRLTDLVHDLLELAKADAGSPLRVGPVLLPHDLADEIALAGRLRPDLTVTVAGDEVEAAFDIAALRTAVRNLMSNAARHARTAITVTITDAPPQVLVDVEDDGPGLPASQVHRVFDRFVRLDSARDRDAGGSGLGLAIVATFAHRSGGTASALPGPGGRFRLTLPAAPTGLLAEPTTLRNGSG